MKKYLNIILTILIFILRQQVFSQNKLIINVKNDTNIAIEKFVILNFQESLPIKINDSTYEFNFNLKTPEYLYIFIDRESRWEQRLWFDPVIFQRELTIDYKNKIVSVTPIKKNEHTNNKEFPKKLKTKIDPNEWDKIIFEANKLQTTGKYEEELKLEEAFITAYPMSYEALWFFTHSHPIYIKNRIEKLELFKKLDSSLSKYTEYKQAKADIIGRKYPRVGDSFLEFELPDFNNKVFKSSLIKNKWILLHFWMDGCSASKKIIPELVELYLRCDSKKIDFISICIEDKKKNWENSNYSNQIQWISVWQEDNFFGSLCLNYNVFATPYFILFNEEKKIVQIWDGDEIQSIENKLTSEGLEK